MTEMISVAVKPRSNTSKVEYNKEKGAYIVYVEASPEKGKANMEVMKVLSKHFKKRVEIIRGFTSKNKIIKILG